MGKAGRVINIVWEIKDALFLSKEDEDTIEHVDMGYKEFVSLVEELAKLAIDIKK
jgi:hypothetical protein